MITQATALFVQPAAGLSMMAPSRAAVRLGDHGNAIFQVENAQ